MLPERRSTPRRRTRDRMPDRETTNPALSHADLKNLLLFLDDDVRESAKALVVSSDTWRRRWRCSTTEGGLADQLEGLAGEQAIFDDLHTLVDTLGSLRGRMGKVASTLRRT